MAYNAETASVSAITAKHKLTNSKKRSKNDILRGYRIKVTGVCQCVREKIKSQANCGRRGVGWLYPHRSPRHPRCAQPPLAAHGGFSPTISRGLRAGPSLYQVQSSLGYLCRTPRREPMRSYLIAAVLACSLITAWIALVQVIA